MLLFCRRNKWKSRKTWRNSFFSQVYTHKHLSLLFWCFIASNTRFSSFLYCSPSGWRTRSIRTEEPARHQQTTSWTDIVCAVGLIGEDEDKEAEYCILENVPRNATIEYVKERIHQKMVSLFALGEPNFVCSLAGSSHRRATPVPKRS